MHTARAHPPLPLNAMHPISGGRGQSALVSGAMSAATQPGTERLSDDELAQLRDGDTSAFEALVKAHHRALLAVARARVGADDADEVVQNAWLKAYKAIGGFEGRAHVRTWLTRIVINESSLRLRQRQREKSVDLGDDAWRSRFDSAGNWLEPPSDWFSANPANILDSEELGECISKTVSALPANQRAVLEMRDFAGLPLAEIAATLKVSGANVRVLLHRARARIYLTIDRFQETGEC